jgi:NADH:ubiquinone oxidoreductase subunit H
LSISFVSYFIEVLLLLSSLAFLTLLERKVLGFMQFRRGPSKTSLGGAFQPFRDSIKLFIKSKVFLMGSLSFIWLVSPVLGVLLLLLNLIILPFGEYVVGFDFSFLFFLLLVSLSVYMVLGRYYSGRKYRLLGMCRSLVQIISYEVVFAFVLLVVLYFRSRYRMVWSCYSCFGFSLLFVLPVFLVLMVMESGRMPFDIVEGESELVSGFNTEYWGGRFSFIFMFEYGMLVVMGVVFCFIFISEVLMLFIFGLVVISFILIRGSFPRIRYDVFLMFSWRRFFFLGLIITSVLLV